MTALSTIRHIFVNLKGNLLIIIDPHHNGYDYLKS